VVVLNPDQLATLPKTTLELAAALAAGYSRSRRGGRVAVHVTTRDQVSKAQGAPAGEVTLRRFKTVMAQPAREAPARPASEERD
jgi:predicted ribosome quality control (RQC) complex YloA/Tae2 family protein